MQLIYINMELCSLQSMLQLFEYQGGINFYNMIRLSPIKHKQSISTVRLVNTLLQIQFKRGVENTIMLINLILKYQHTHMDVSFCHQQPPPQPRSILGISARQNIRELNRSMESIEKMIERSRKLIKSKSHRQQLHHPSHSARTHICHQHQTNTHKFNCKQTSTHISNQNKTPVSNENQKHSILAEISSSSKAQQTLISSSSKAQQTLIASTNKDKNKQVIYNSIQKQSFLKQREIGGKQMVGNKTVYKRRTINKHQQQQTANQQQNIHSDLVDSPHEQQSTTQLDNQSSPQGIRQQKLVDYITSVKQSLLLNNQQQQQLVLNNQQQQLVLNNQQQLLLNNQQQLLLNNQQQQLLPNNQKQQHQAASKHHQTQSKNSQTNFNISQNNSKEGMVTFKKDYSKPFTASKQKNLMIYRFSPQKTSSINQSHKNVKKQAPLSATHSKLCESQPSNLDGNKHKIKLKLDFKQQNKQHFENKCQSNHKQILIEDDSADQNVYHDKTQIDQHEREIQEDRKARCKTDYATRQSEQPWHCYILQQDDDPVSFQPSFSRKKSNIVIDDGQDQDPKYTINSQTAISKSNYKQSKLRLVKELSQLEGGWANEKERRQKFDLKIKKYGFVEKYLSEDQIWSIYGKLVESGVSELKWPIYIVDEVYRRMKQQN